MARALNDLVNSSAPDKGVGLTLNIPLRNRAAQSAQVRSELEYRQAQMRLQQIENQIRIEVRNAQFAVQQNRASVESAQAAVRLGHESLDAEQKKFNLGASTSTLVLQNRSALATAESTLVSAMAAYEKSRTGIGPGHRAAAGSCRNHHGRRRTWPSHAYAERAVCGPARKSAVGDASGSAVARLTCLR